MRSMSSSVSTPGLNFSRDQPLRISAATRTLSRTLSVLNVSSRWNVRPMPSRARWCGLIVVMSLPSSTTVPPVGGCRPVMTLNRVVLPAPLGPMRPVTSFSGTSMVTAARAWRPPKRTETWSTLRSATTREHTRRPLPGHQVATLVGSAAELHRDPDLAVAAVRDAHAGRRVRAVEDVLAVPG